MKKVFPLIFTILIAACGNQQLEKQLSQQQDEITALKKALDSSNRKGSSPQLSSQTGQSPVDSSPPAPFRPAPHRGETKEGPPRSGKRFCFVVTHTIEPKVSFIGGYNVTTPYKEVNISKVMEVDNFDEDERYRLIDRFEKEIRIDYFLSIDNGLAINHSDERCSITSSECHAFKTYREASIANHQLTNGHGID